MSSNKSHTQANSNYQSLYLWTSFLLGMISLGVVIWNRGSSFAIASDRMQVYENNNALFHSEQYRESSIFTTLILSVLIYQTSANPTISLLSGLSSLILQNLPAVSSQFPPVLSLTSLNGSNGFRIDGVDGFTVEQVGDVNGDDYEDFIINSFLSPSASIVFGRAGPFNSSISLANLNGSNGFNINVSSTEWDWVSLYPAGDINGDKISDFIIKPSKFMLCTGIKRMTAACDAGKSYVYFGHTGTFNSPLFFSNLDGGNGFRIDEIQIDLGSSFVTTGDFNSDNITDILFGYSPYSVSKTKNQIYVVLGRNGTFPSTVSLANLDGRNGFKIDLFSTNGYRSFSLASLEDFNGDNVRDLIIGLPYAKAKGLEDTGQTLVIFDQLGLFNNTLSLSNLNGRNGFRIDGLLAGEKSGNRVGSLKDVNGDGLDDIFIESDWAKATDGNYQVAKTYIIFGNNKPFNATLSLADLNGRNGFKINRILSSNYNVTAVDPAGDINGDGIHDIFVSTQQNQTGDIFIILGRVGSFPASISFNNLTALSGFRISIDRLTISFLGSYGVKGIGDFNGDKINDIAIWKPYTDPTGNLFVILGQHATNNLVSTKLGLASTTVPLSDFSTVSSMESTSKKTIQESGPENISSTAAISVETTTLLSQAESPRTTSSNDLSMKNTEVASSTENLNLSAPIIGAVTSGIVLSALLTVGFYACRKKTHTEKSTSTSLSELPTSLPTSVSLNYARIDEIKKSEKQYDDPARLEI